MCWGLKLNENKIYSVDESERKCPKSKFDSKLKKFDNFQEHDLWELFQ